MWCRGVLTWTLFILPLQPCVILAPAARAADGDSEKFRVTRSDLAKSYLRLEQAYFARTLDETRRAEVNRAFDRATLAFFLGRFGDALRTIDTLAGSLAEQPPSTASVVISSLSVQVEPPVMLHGTTTAAQVRVASLYEVEREPVETLECELHLVSPGGVRAASVPFSLEVGNAVPIDLRVPLDLSETESRLQPDTTYKLVVTEQSGWAVEVGRWPVVSRSFDALRKRNADRLLALPLPGTELEDAWAICRARNELLTDVPSTNNSAQFLADPNELAASLNREIEALAAEKNPYYQMPGDYWRVLNVGRISIPLRIFAPETDRPTEPRPLWIVLHGAGGDNMFLDAYGAGRIKQLASEHNCLVASPLTYSFGGRPDHVAALIDSLSRDYAIDRSRIYMIGHSMGAGAAATAATSCRDQLAAVCCIAGGRGFSSADRIAPTLVIVPELDAVVPPRSVVGAAEAAQSAGAEVELRVLPGYGHTLVVGAMLPEVVEWLLQHRLMSNAE